MVSVLTSPIPYSINMDIFDQLPSPSLLHPHSHSHSHPHSVTSSLPRIDTPAYPSWTITTSANPLQNHSQALPDPVSATSLTSGDSWPLPLPPASANAPSPSPSSSAMPAYPALPETPFYYPEGYDRPWLFSPPSGFRKGLKKTDLRPIHAPTKARSHLPRSAAAAAAAAGGSRSTPYSRPESAKPARQRSRSTPGSAKSAGSSPSPEQLAKLEKRRRANAEAQRLSRQRKEETLQALREDVEKLTQRTAVLGEDLVRLRALKVEADRTLAQETEKANQLQVEVERRRQLRRQRVQGAFVQMQAEQGMTPLISGLDFGSTFTGDNFWGLT